MEHIPMVCIASSWLFLLVKERLPGGKPDEQSFEPNAMKLAENAKMNR
jgi:hypothetical protein